MRKRFYIVIAVFISLTSLSQGIDLKTSQHKKVTYSFYGKQIPFVYFKNHEITISANCYKKTNQKYKCQALNALSLLEKIKFTNEKLPNGKMFGVHLCKEYLLGEEMTGRNKKGGEVSFCKFKDKSYLSSGSFKTSLRR